MNRARFLHLAWTAGFLVAASMFIPTTGYSQTDTKVAKAMADLKAATNKLGTPKLEGMDPVSGKNAAALYFGKTKVNNDFSVVDAVTRENGGTATLFAKTEDEYVRVSTNVPKGDGRATGTILDPKGKVIVQINAGKPFYGDVDILGTMYSTGYEPIKDASGKIIGIWYVGYKK
ncbi:Cache 3/Cache 2 fusion domain-containing protein [Beijerinckia indica]|uniref:Cache 3/Cache 2 fusion domain-containing protein n=1 Tax=Beijerinckia indica subsp. indica (strain ATCC 9039 / DSM 1715 / NCIMB 8712) TaxID=395963 RepID=B2IG04_BEII9|nr:Cache 3/Cache 2 fusion domain-containing protein [Beijerinckia indica]ACB95743.1 hypothetical protein Bind_2123 [Beijerinckia indica subsp. indica ATCC 9039]